MRFKTHPFAKPTTSFKKSALGFFALSLFAVIVIALAFVTYGFNAKKRLSIPDGLPAPSSNPSVDNPISAGGMKNGDAAFPSGIDPAYISNAESTGGQLFLLDSDGLDKALEDFVAPQISGDFVTIARAKGNLVGDPKILTVPVDSTISRLVISVSTDIANSVNLIRPSGVKVIPSDLGVKFTTISSGSFITIEKPDLGQWQASISGSGNFTMAAQANSPLDLFIFEFVEKVRLRGWDSYVPISGQPVSGALATGRATLIGPFKTAVFRLVDEAGNTLQAVDFKSELSGTSISPFVGPVALPNVPFRISVSGVDVNGNAYERLFSTLFQAQSVEVIIDPKTTLLRLPRNATTTFRFNVHNLGEADAFQITVADNLGFAQTPNPSLLTLGTGETKSFTVDVVAPIEVPDGSALLLTAVATSSTNPDLTNSAVVTDMTF